VLGEYYGTPVPDAGDQDVVLEIDVQGATRVRDRCEHVVCVLLLAPSRAAQEERLRGRGDDEAHVAKRLQLGEHEVEVGRQFADAIVINDDLERATAELAAIVEASRQRFSS
jgi:guanylate kinase